MITDVISKQRILKNDTELDELANNTLYTNKSGLFFKQKSNIAFFG